MNDERDAGDGDDAELEPDPPEAEPLVEEIEDVTASAEEEG
jgi:hypothetical protein